MKKKSKKEVSVLRPHIPFKSSEIKDVHLVVETLLDCIKTGDIESFREVLTAHLMTVNKAGIGRRTLYDLIDPKKEFNPELSTISALINALAA